MTNQPISAHMNSSPRGIKADTPIGGITVNLNLYDKLPNATINNTNNGVTMMALRSEEELKPKILQPSIQPMKQEIPISQFTEKTKGNDFKEVDFVWPVSTSVKPIKKKAVRLKPSQPIVLLPFASLINTEDAVTILRKLQFY